MSVPRRPIGRIALLALLAAHPTPCGAQEREGSAKGRRPVASATLPLDDVAYAYIDALIARGRLRQLPAMDRPYRVYAVRRSLEQERRGGSSGEAAALAALDRILTDYEFLAGASDSVAAPEDRVDVVAALSGLATTQTSARRELMLADQNSGTFGGAVARAQARESRLVVVTRIIGDLRLRRDPEFTGKKNRMIAGRVEDAYASVEWRYGSIFFGRTARNWGPSALDGLLLGHYTYSYDHLYGRLGGDRFSLSTLMTRLDDDTSSGTVSHRFFSIHRLAGRFRDVEVALTEAMLYGGPGENFITGFVNPLNIFDLSQYNETGRGNVAFGLETSWRSPVGVFGAQGLLDDAQVDDCKPGCEEPASYGFTLTAEGLPLYGDGRWFAWHTRVSNLSYRTASVAERYTSQQIGLGRGFSDYDETRVGIEVLPWRGLPVRGYLALRRQGEGDYRLPYPAAQDFATTPGFLSGVVMRVRRIGVTARGMPLPWVRVDGDGGINRLSNADHVRGRSRTRFEGRLRVEVSPPPLRASVAP